ncbi:unnamed protein product [Moneuplotes crassus]|uniref:Uncharacterized protein n=1 Tax=Euplotes crassus TaxID=5936 RepID=A0AAD1XXH8_EUPCR|nr:unnamed protein product [Moneuplotes crassus]
MTEELKEVTIKVVLIGDAGVGKTTLINRYLMDTFDPFEPPTLSGGFRTKDVILEDLHTKVTLQIWDTAGQERFRALVENYYREAQFVLVCYEIISEESFDAARNWIEEVKDKAPEEAQFFICGTKSDLNDQRMIQTIHGMRLAKEYNAQFGETSAKKNNGVNEVFEEIAKKYVETIKRSPVRSSTIKTGAGRITETRPKKDKKCAC